MSMYTLLRNDPQPTMAKIEDAFDGNLCRCTGYRPILDGFKTFAADAFATSGGCCGGKDKEGGGCCMAPSAELDEQPGIRTLRDVTVEFAPYDATQEVIFPPELLLQPEASHRAVLFRSARTLWYRPASLAELLRLKEQYTQAKIVVGNTEIGIETKFKGARFPVLVTTTAVPELNQLRHTETGISVGGAVTVNRLRSWLEELVATAPTTATGTYRALLENIRWFAGDQIRNVAAVGGNVVTASPISDLNPILMASGSLLTVASAARGARTIAVKDFFLGYRKTALAADEVLVTIEIPATGDLEFIQAYKQARRRDDDIAIVNACFRVRLKREEQGGYVVIDGDMAFGGLAPTTVLAVQGSNTLQGQVWNDALVDRVADALAKDFLLKPETPGGMVEYRQTLAPSFFMKFYLEVIQACKIGDGVPERELSALDKRHRPVSRAVQVFQEPLVGKGADDPVGAPLIHASALKQATGEAAYTDDLPPYSNELYGALVLSQRAHAKVLIVDATQALACPGVEAFISAADVPGCNSIGPILTDEECFVTKEVHTVGAVLGVVVADTQVWREPS